MFSTGLASFWGFSTLPEGVDDAWFSASDIWTGPEGCAEGFEFVVDWGCEAMFCEDWLFAGWRGTIPGTDGLGCWDDADCSLDGVLAPGIVFGTPDGVENPAGLSFGICAEGRGGAGIPPEVDLDVAEEGADADRGVRSGRLLPFFVISWICPESAIPEQSPGNHRKLFCQPCQHDMHKFNEKCLMSKFWNCLKQHKKIGRVLFESTHASSRQRFAACRSGHKHLHLGDYNPSHRLGLV